jgi:aminodeoxyfutalosine deaminase
MRNVNGTGPYPPDMALDEDALIAMPKADLHVHLVGSAAPRTVVALAARHPDSGVPASIDELEALFTFRDFAHFIEVYRAVSSLVRTPDDVVTLVKGLASDMQAQGVGYAEVTVTPVTHMKAGIRADDLAQALDTGASEARALTGVELAWIYDISGTDGRKGAELTLRAALEDPPLALIGFGLGGPEAGVCRTDYRGEFDAARAAGLHSLPHAGESVGPEEVWAAIEVLSAERIGHGISAVSDARLLDRLRDERIVLEICPSSNVATGIVTAFAEHPLPRLLEAGVPVVLGSDDPPMFNTTLLDEYRRVSDSLGLTSGQLRALARASIDASFAPTHLKRQMLLAHT